MLQGDVVTVTCPTTGQAAAGATGTHSVTFAPFTLQGAGAPNYTLTQPAISATITKAQARIWFSGGLVQFVDVNGGGVGLPSASANPLGAGTLLIDWHDGTQPTAPGRYRVNLTLDSDDYQAASVATFVTVLQTLSLPQGSPQPSIGPVTANDEEGEPVTPTLAPSTATVKRDAQPIGSTVTRPTPSQDKVEEVTGEVVLAFAAKANRDGEERPLAAEGDLVLLAGGVLNITGTGFQANTTIELWMFSKTVLLGTATADPNGTFAAQFDVPPTMAAGEHVIQLNGMTSSGKLGSSSLGVLVEVPESNDDPQPARDLSGQLLRAPVSGPVAVVGNRMADLKITNTTVRSLFTRNTNALKILSNGTTTTPFTLTLSSPSGRNPQIRVVDRALVVPPAAQLQGTFDGLAPFTAVNVWLLSEPQLLGRVVTDEFGAVELLIRLPEDVTYGRHTLQLVGRSTNGLPVSVAVGVWATPASSAFTDVNIDHTHGAAIAILAERGVVNGFGYGRFRPTQAVTRGHAATMLAGLFALELAEVNDVFSDMATSAHAGSIAALANAGVATGFADGTFQPDMAITRGQAAMLLTRLIKLEASENDSTVFIDIAGRNDTEAIRALHAAGLVVGFANGSFHPDAPITRAQFASLIVNAHYQLP